MFFLILLRVREVQVGSKIVKIGGLRGILVPCFFFGDHVGPNIGDLGTTGPLEQGTWPFEKALGAKSWPQEAFLEV